MATKLTQSVVDKIRHDHKPKAQVHDAEVSGLRIVVGTKSASYKLMGRINDGFAFRRCTLNEVGALGSRRGSKLLSSVDRRNECLLLAPS